MLLRFPLRDKRLGVAPPVGLSDWFRGFSVGKYDGQPTQPFFWGLVRRGRRIVDWIYADEDDAPPSEGLRNSTHCPVKRVLESFPEYRDQFYEFDRGVGRVGHRIQREFCEGHLLPNCERLTVEYEIPWEHGITHIDAACWGGEAQGTWEVKSYDDRKDSDPNPPSAYRWQVRRMWRLAERAGITLPEPWRIVMIGKLKDRRHVFPVELLAEHRDVIDREIEGINEVMRVASRGGPYMLTKSVFSEAGLVCECGGCFPKPLVEAGATARELLDQISVVISERDRAVEEKKLRDAEVKALKDTYETLRERLKGHVKEGERLTDGDLVASLTKKGVLTIKRVEAKV